MPAPLGAGKSRHRQRRISPLSAGCVIPALDSGTPLPETARGVFTFYARRRCEIRRRRHLPQMPQNRGPRINRQIRISPIRLIDGEGNQVGIIETYEALRRAEEAGLDLVEVSPQARPPVCKLMDYGRHKYEKNRQEVGRYEFYNLLEKCLIEVELTPKDKQKMKDLDLEHTLIKDIKGLAMLLSRFKPADWNKFLDVVIK